MGRLSLPRAQAIRQEKVNEFLGADYSQSSDISKSRSPDTMNMIRDTPGKVRKWMGYAFIKEYTDKRINGVHIYKGANFTKRIIHAGDTLYLDNGAEVFNDETMIDGMNDDYSVSVQIEGNLCIFDGLKMRIVKNTGEDTFSIQNAEDLAKIPMVIISRNPSGGGTTLDAVNLLTPKREVGFLGTGTDKIYQLPSVGIDEEAVTAKFLNADGSYTQKTEGSDFTVDRTLGKVTFATAPPEPSVTGKDNVFITYAKTVEGYADRINKATVCSLYGSYGALDRVFCAGGYKGNYDYYSQLNDPTYFGDLSYSIIGGDNSNIMGYTIINDRLATHLDDSYNDTNTIFREGVILNDKTIFRLTGSCQGDGAASKYAFAVLSAEPVYMAKRGVYAVTSTDYTNEKYAQNRSYYIDELLTKQDLSTAYSCVHDGFYLVAAGEYIFALDSLQLSRERNLPYSTRLYEGYARNGINARILWEQDGEVWFGTETGAIKQFYTDKNLLASYNDEGRAIPAVWSTPFIDGSEFHYKKKYKRIAVLLGAAVATSCRIYAEYDGIKELIYDYDGIARYFSYSQFQYSKMSYKTDQTAQLIIEKLSGIKPDSRKVKFIFENDLLDEPFALENSSVEYVQTR